MKEFLIAEQKVLFFLNQGIEDPLSINQNTFLNNFLSAIRSCFPLSIFIKLRRPCAIEYLKSMIYQNVDSLSIDSQFIKQSIDKQLHDIVEMFLFRPNGIIVSLEHCRNLDDLMISCIRLLEDQASNLSRGLIHIETELEKTLEEFNNYSNRLIKTRGRLEELSNKLTELTQSVYSIKLENKCIDIADLLIRHTGSSIHKLNYKVSNLTPLNSVEDIIEGYIFSCKFDDRRFVSFGKYIPAIKQSFFDYFQLSDYETIFQIEEFDNEVHLKVLIPVQCQDFLITEIILERIFHQEDIIDTIDKINLAIFPFKKIDTEHKIPVKVFFRFNDSFSGICFHSLLNTLNRVTDIHMTTDEITNTTVFSLYEPFDVIELLYQNKSLYIIPRYNSKNEYRSFSHLLVSLYNNQLAFCKTDEFIDKCFGIIHFLKKNDHITKMGAFLGDGETLFSNEIFTRFYLAQPRSSHDFTKSSLHRIQPYFDIFVWFLHCLSLDQNCESFEIRVIEDNLINCCQERKDAISQLFTRSFDNNGIDAVFKSITPTSNSILDYLQQLRFAFFDHGALRGFYKLNIW